MKTGTIIKPLSNYGTYYIKILIQYLFNLLFITYKITKIRLYIIDSKTENKIKEKKTADN